MFEHVGHTPGAVARARSLRRRMNSPEKRLWAELRRLDANIRRQAPIGRYVADFASHSKRLVIEIDGGIHERIAEVAAKDLEPTHWLEAQGYRVIRFTDSQVMNDIRAVVAEVEFHLALPLDGGGVGGGVAAALTRSPRSTPNGDSTRASEASPPSPTLPPSRGKGE